MNKCVSAFPFIKNRVIVPPTIEDEFMLMFSELHTVVLDIDVPPSVKCEKIFGGNLFYMATSRNGVPAFLSSFQIFSSNSITQQKDAWCIIDSARYGDFVTDDEKGYAMMHHRNTYKKEFNEFWKLTPTDEGYMK